MKAKFKNLVLISLITIAPGLAYSKGWRHSQIKKPEHLAYDWGIMLTPGERFLAQFGGKWIETVKDHKKFSELMSSGLAYSKLGIHCNFLFTDTYIKMRFVNEKLKVICKKGNHSYSNEIICISPKKRKLSPLGTFESPRGKVSLLVSCKKKDNPPRKGFKIIPKEKKDTEI